MKQTQGSQYGSKEVLFRQLVNPLTGAIIELYRKLNVKCRSAYINEELMNCGAEKSSYD
jgi:hypothetical protein